VVGAHSIADIRMKRPRSRPCRIPPFLVGERARFKIARPWLHAPRLDSLQFEPVGNRPAQFESFVQSEVKRWTGVVNSAGVKVK
jgi:hypothetical protein